MEGKILVTVQATSARTPWCNCLMLTSQRSWGGANVYCAVWQPLLKSKFGPYAEEVSTVWFWNQLKLCGGSQGKAGEERLAYFKGGFVTLAEPLPDEIRDLGGRIELESPITKVQKIDGC